ncbi:hypothetical protein AB6735_22985 [Mucilaginibacter sp. RCC_168]|uniref:hypothetical protein n=1 Tax=Mucilaginibacter sp. RCC_168 TaxID=3239221 RepID=UPI003523B25E
MNGKADNVIVKNLSVNYKGSTSNWRGSLFGSVDNGVFNLIHENNSWLLNYQINMHKLFITTSTMSIIMAVFMLVNSGPWWVGIVAFLWLCGVNWIINLIRHRTVATDIATGIDELIFGKTELPPEQDKMIGELKNWFYVHSGSSARDPEL